MVFVCPFKKNNWQKGVWVWGTGPHVAQAGSDSQQSCLSPCRAGITVRVHCGAQLARGVAQFSSINFNLPGSPRQGKQLLPPSLASDYNPHAHFSYPTFLCHQLFFLTPMRTEITLFFICVSPKKKDINVITTLLSNYNPPPKVADFSTNILYTCYFFQSRVSHSLGWPWNCYIVKDGLELLIFPASSLWVLRL